MQKISKQINFICLSFSLFVGFSFLILMLGNSNIEVNIVVLACIIYILLTIALYYYFKNLLKDNLKGIFSSYTFLSKLFVFGLIISIIALYMTSNEYYTSAWKISTFVYSSLLVISLIIFSIKNGIVFKKRGNNYKVVLIETIDLLIKFVFILFFGYVIAFLLGLFLFMITGLFTTGFGPELI